MADSAVFMGVSCGLTTQAEPCRANHVNRESGVENASRRWLQRMVRLNLRVIFPTTEKIAEGGKLLDDGVKVLLKIRKRAVRLKLSICQRLQLRQTQVPPVSESAANAPCENCSGGMRMMAWSTTRFAEAHLLGGKVLIKIL
jgi:hypothetical protein